MTFLAFSLAIAFAVAFGVQTVRVRRLTESRDGWSINGVVLPDPEDPRWSAARHGALRLGGVVVSKCDFFRAGTIVVSGACVAAVDSPMMICKRSYRYVDAVERAYANRKALEAMTS